MAHLDYSFLYFDDTAPSGDVSDAGAPTGDNPVEQPVTGDNATDDKPSSKEKKPDPREEKKYSDKDFDAFKLRLKAESEKKANEAAKKASEAAKMAKMNELEKAQYQLANVQKELDDLKRTREVEAMSREVRRMLNDGGVNVPETLSDALVREDAETTKAATDAFIKAFKAAVQDGVMAKLNHKAPRTSGTSGKSITREDIFKEKDLAKQARLVRENPELFPNANRIKKR